MSHHRTTGPANLGTDSARKGGYFCGWRRNRRNHKRSGKLFKRKIANVQIVAVNRAVSPVLSGGKAAPHMIQGIGAGFIPDTLNTKVYDEIITVGNEEAFETGRIFARTEGVLVGISSGEL